MQDHNLAAQDAGEALRACLSDTHQLPISPSLFMKLMELGKKLDASAADYARVIESSTALTGKILSTVNSSFFGIRHRVTRVLQAVNLLGTTSVRLVAIGHCLAAVHGRIRLPDDVLDHYWHGGLVKAVAARLYASHLDSSQADEAFLVGLMQDMAMPIMHHLRPEVYLSSIFAAPTLPRELEALEREAFGMAHGQAARMLAERLGLPENLCAALESHHEIGTLAPELVPTELSEAVGFASLFPHVPTHWSGLDIASADQARQRLGPQFEDLAGLVKRILAEYRTLAGHLRPADTGRADLTSLLRAASAELAAATVTMAGKAHATSSSGAGNGEAVAPAEPVDAKYLDDLTGALNRRGLDRLGPEVVQRAQTAGQALLVAAVGVADLDSICSQFGPAASDRVLVHVGNTVRQVLGPEASLAWTGGDEFIALLPGPGQTEARTALDRLVVAVTVDAPGVQGRPVSVAVHVGAVWTGRPGVEASLPDLLRESRAQRIRAAATGRGALAFMSFRGK